MNSRNLCHHLNCLNCLQIDKHYTKCCHCLYRRSQSHFIYHDLCKCPSRKGGPPQEQPSSTLLKTQQLAENRLGSFSDTFSCLHFRQEAETPLLPAQLGLAVLLLGASIMAVPEVSCLGRGCKASHTLDVAQVGIPPGAEEVHHKGLTLSLGQEHHICLVVPGKHTEPVAEQ